MQEIFKDFIDHQIDFFDEIENIKTLLEANGIKGNKVNKLANIQEEFNGKFLLFLEKIKKEGIK